MSSDDSDRDREPVPSFDDLIHSSPYRSRDHPFFIIFRFRRFYRLARLYSPVHAAVELFSSPDIQIRAIFFYHYRFTRDPGVKEYVRHYLHMRHYRGRITPDEVQYILANYRRKSVKEIAKDLNRSVKTIYAIIHRHRDEKRRYRYLSESEISYIIEQYLYKKRSMLSIAKELNRPVSTVYYALKRRNLK